MSRTSRNLMLVLAIMLSMGSRAVASTVSLTVSGAEQQLVSGGWDSGNITIAFGDTVGHAYTETIAYGQFSTPAGIASSFGALFSQDYASSGLCAHAVGTVIYLQLAGAATFGAPTITNPSISFAFTPTSWSVTPTVIWDMPPSITYGTALSSTQLDAIAFAPTQSGAQLTLPGTFAYSPASGAVPNAGSQTLSVTFTPTNNATYTTATSTVTLTVSQATPTLSLATSGTPSANGASVTFTATVSSGPTGTITFHDGGASIGTGTISGTTATLSTTSLVAGLHTITASWAGNTNYVAETSSPIVQNVNGFVRPGPGVIETFAGDGTYGYLGNPAFATSAELAQPGSVAVDSSGNIYIADSVNNVIRMVSASTGFISTVIGSGTAGSLGDLGPAISASLNDPSGIAFDSSGNLYIADSGDNRIRIVTASNGVITSNSIITTVAGTGTPSYDGNVGDFGAAGQAKLTEPTGVTVDASGNLYIADRNNNRVRKVTASNGLVNSNSIITTVAGNGNAIPVFSGASGPAGSAELFWPWSVALDASGNLYIADAENFCIRKVAASNGAITSSSTITTVVGDGTLNFSGDTGLATAAELAWPVGVSFDNAGNLYIADMVNNRIRKVTAVNGIIAANSIINTVAGGGIRGYSGDGDPATSHNVALDEPQGIALDAAGNLYIADSYNSVIRVVGSGGIVPALNWTPPPAISYGTALGTNQLNATASVAGTYTYSPVAGSVLAVGQNTLSVTFTPTDTADYSSLSASVPLTVSQATSTITWGIPAAISDSTPLGSTQLNATASTTGTFTYSPAAGTVLDPGTQLLTVVFTPSNTTNYTSVTAYTTIDVNSGSTHDAGTVTLSVNSGSGYAVVASTNYSAGATTSSIAQGLAGNVVSGAPVNVYADGDQVSIVALGTCVVAGTCASTNYPYIIQTPENGWDLGQFPSPSFADPPIEGSLQGGSNGSSAQQTVYSVPSISYDAVGNIAGYTDATVHGMGTWTFSYDSLNRLSGASTNQTGNPTPVYCWYYDMFGNRWQQESSSAQFQTGSGGPSPCLPQTSPTVETQLTSFNSNNNQVTFTNVRGVAFTPTYDAAGNMTSDGNNTYLYDAEGRVCAVASTPVDGMTELTGYIYDADGIRVSKGTIQQWSCNPATNGYATSSDYILGPSGEQLSEYMITPGGTMAWQHTNVWVGGSLIATYSQDSVSPTSGQQGLLHFYLDDWLGSRRVQTDYAGNIEQTCNSLPFGDGETCASSPTEHLFTGKERDAESGNDYFGARYYASSMGRFMSPDPGPFIWRDPQTLNRYMYVRNNPLRLVDPTGKYFVVAAEMRQQVQQYISTMLRSPQGAATINAIAASSKPVSFGLGSLPRTQNGASISVTNGTTVPTAGSHPGEVGGAQVTLDNSNISFTADKKGTTDFYMGLKAFAHEDQHVTDILGASTFQGAAAAGAAGDAPSAPGANDTTGGSAEGRALDIMGELGGAGQNYQPDAQMDSLAGGILDQGAAIQSGNAQQLIQQATAPSGCTSSSEGGQVCH